MKRSSTSQHFFFASLATLALLSVGLYVRSHGSVGSGVEVIEGLDTSASERIPDKNGATALGRSIALMAKVAARLDHNRDHLTVFRVDHDAQEFYNQLAPRSRERFQWQLIHETQTRASRTRTLSYTFWEAAAQRAERSATPVVICLGSNGDCDDLTPVAHARLRRAAQQLARNPRVFGVWIFGAHAKNWVRLRKDFAALGSRLHLQNSVELDAGSLLAELEAARLSPSRHPHDEVSRSGSKGTITSAS